MCVSGSNSAYIFFFKCVSCRRHIWIMIHVSKAPPAVPVCCGKKSMLLVKKLVNKTPEIIWMKKAKPIIIYRFCANRLAKLLAMAGKEGR